MVRNIMLILVTMSFFNSCSSQKCKAKVLLNNKTKVPIDFTLCFHNKKYQTTSLIGIIDTNYIYEEITKRSDGWHSVLRFYPSGKLNYFSFEDGTTYDTNSFNPLIHGLRGTIAQDSNGENYVLYYTIINHSGDWGIKAEKLVINGNEIKLVDKTGSATIYKKKAIPKGLLSYEADW
ncbi:hypothetical protein [Chryseobacterium gallinarum]|uniref:Uncharacterized protein n=1 Tax=Chryseobacterium gallinarum TaxID=1324352 RepID=A0ABX6KT31_CHRGL|nr:hypothetical protein [Chryseobacterium gallinarum]QIY91647.1 hypothetical protein FOB44_13740 [Chryseobacterium gallinarum]